MTDQGSHPSASSNNARFLPLLLLLFACSGCAALIYEIVWYQLLQFVIGSTAVSLAVLLSTFMGGLCLGSLFFARMVAQRGHHPLRLYAAIEAGIGVCGLFVLLVMPAAGTFYTTGAGHGAPALLLRAIICGICLLPPTILMGASLPTIARWVSPTPIGASRLGLLYGGNTLGAVFGCLLGGFYLLRVFDMSTATYAAAAINLLVAVVSLLLATHAPDRPDSNSVSNAPTPAESQTANHRAGASSPLGPIYVATAISGACALGAEVLWTRLLSLILGATVYTFSVILAVFLLGLGIGGITGAWLSLAVRAQKALGYCQLLLTTAIFWTAFTLVDSIPYWPIDPRRATSPWFTFQIDLVRVLWTILPPALLWGASFPLALAAVATTSRDEDRARPVGIIYATNTAGAIVGALTFGLLLIPHIGTANSERILILLSEIAALCMLVPFVWSCRGKLATFGLAASVIVASLLTWLVPPVPPAIIAYGRLLLDAGDSQILYVGEGLNSSIAISQSGDIRQFHVSGKIEASTGPYDMRLQRMLADWPALLHPDPRSALVVGFGAGITAGSFTLIPSIQRIVVCEIEPLVPPAAETHFGAENDHVLKNERTEIVYEDARNYILSTREKFDVITSDPIHPWVKGSAVLYTKEYFELEKEHLNPGGIVTQWVPLYETDEQTVKSAIATFFSVFPNGTIWANEGDGNGYDLIMLGQADQQFGQQASSTTPSTPMTIDVDKLQHRLDRPDYGGLMHSLRAVGIESAVDLLGTYAGRHTDLQPWLAGAAINRDGNLRLQYLGGWALNAKAQSQIYSDILRYRKFPEDLIVGSPVNVEILRHQHDPQ